MPLTLELTTEGSELSSGYVLIRNPAQKSKLRQDLSGAQDTERFRVIMDTGAGITLLPASLIGKLKIQEPDPDTHHWPIMQGVGGITYGFIPDAPIQIELGSEGQMKYWTSLYPCVYQGAAPAFHACGEILDKFRQDSSCFPKWISAYVDVPFRLHKYKFSALVSAPSETCEVLDRRAHLQINEDHGDIDYILLGRDWQKRFNLCFGEKTLIITGRRQRTR